MRYAKIVEQKVENVIVLLDEDVALMPSDWELVKTETANIGDEYINGVFIAQAPAFVEPPPAVRVITPIAFKLRFTSAERVAINNSTDPIVVDFLSILNDTRLAEIDLDSTVVTDALAKLEELAILTPERAAEIIA